MQFGESSQNLEQKKHTKKKLQTPWMNISIFLFLCIYIYIYISISIYNTRKGPKICKKNTVNNICKIQNIVFFWCSFGGVPYIYIYLYINLRGFTSFVQIGENAFRFHLYKIFWGCGLVIQKKQLGNWEFFSSRKSRKSSDVLPQSDFKQTLVF